MFHTTYSIWAGIRDLGNLVIILFLGFIAISLITGFLGQATKKSVIWVLGAALLINFSGVITLFVYNTGNALAEIFFERHKTHITDFLVAWPKKEKPVIRDIAIKPKKKRIITSVLKLEACPAKMLCK